MTYRLRWARDWLHSGGVVAYPTEAVYGLGCDPCNEQAIARLLRLKRRAPDKGLILIAADYEQLRPFVLDLEPERMASILASWPGPNTWLLPVREETSPLLTGRFDTLAVRVTAHPVAAGLCRAWGGALVSTSANRSGGEPVRDADAARKLFGADIDTVVEGAVGGRERPTPIRDARTGQTLRE